MKPAPPVINTRCAIAAPGTCQFQGRTQGKNVCSPDAVANYRKALVWTGKVLKLGAIPRHSPGSDGPRPDASAGVGCGEPQMYRKGSGDVGEGRALPDRSGPHVPECEHRHLLAGMVRSPPSRIA